MASTDFYEPTLDADGNPVQGPKIQEQPQAAAPTGAPVPGDFNYVAPDSRPNAAVADKLLEAGHISPTLHATLVDHPTDIFGGAQRFAGPEQATVPMGVITPASHEPAPETAHQPPSENVSAPKPMATKASGPKTAKSPSASAMGLDLTEKEQGIQTEQAQGNIDAAKNLVDTQNQQTDKVASATETALTNDAIKRDTDVRDMEQAYNESAQWHNDYQKQVAQAMDAKVDPNRLWRNMSTAGTIMSGIALALGAIGGGGGHGNAAVEVIEKAVGRDIAAQSADIDNKYKGLSMTASDQNQKEALNARRGQDLAQLRAQGLSTALAQTQVIAQRAGIPLNDAKLQATMVPLQANLKEAQLSVARYKLAQKQAQERAAAAAAAHKLQRIEKAEDTGTEFARSQGFFSPESFSAWRGRNPDAPEGKYDQDMAAAAAKASSKGNSSAGKTEVRYGIPQTESILGEIVSDIKKNGGEVPTAGFVNRVTGLGDMSSDENKKFNDRLDLLAGSAAKITGLSKEDLLHSFTTGTSDKRKAAILSVGELVHRSKKTIESKGSAGVDGSEAGEGEH